MITAQSRISATHQVSGRSCIITVDNGFDEKLDYQTLNIDACEKAALERYVDGEHLETRQYGSLRMTVAAIYDLLENRVSFSDLR